MPEGDTIHLAAKRLEPILVGRTVEEFWSRKLRGLRPRAGQRIEAVRAVGKHLLVDFERGLTLDTHLGMTGWWRTFPPDADLERAMRNPKLRLRIATDAGTAMCFAAPTIETFVRDADVTPIDRLGPDLVAVGPDFDFGVIVGRARDGRDVDTMLIDVVMDQRIASGIGNVYKSEALHVERLWPFRRLGEVDDDRLADLFATASSQLRDNVRSAGPRATTPHGGHFVYDRWRKPCLRCGMPIERSYRGELSRSTYWCPQCQSE